MRRLLQQPHVTGAACERSTRSEQYGGWASDGGRQNLCVALERYGTTA